MRTYVQPVLPQGTTVARLQPTDLPTNELSPDRLVLVFNRSPNVLLCQFDSRHYEFPPGWSEVRYDAAVHCQGRLVIPGTRDPDQIQAVDSYLVIAGIDDAQNAVSRCVPLTAAEQRRYGLKTEGIDREAMPVDVDRRVKKVDLRKQGGRFSQGVRAQGKRPQGDISKQATEGARAAAAEAFVPPARSDAERDAATAPAKRGEEE